MKTFAFHPSSTPNQVNMSSVGFNPEFLMGTSNQASILAIGTSNPPNIFLQDSYPDFYFGITNSNHLVDLKAKFKRICEKSGIRKRHMFVTEKFLKEHPNMCMTMAPSLDVRQEVVAKEMPKLGKEAASKAIKEWGQPLSSITHLVFSTTSSMNLPGTDYDVSKALGLDASVNRLLLCQQGCFAGGTALRVAKDIAENNKGARVLAICVETSSIIFRGPSQSYLDNLVGAAIFADGASAIVVGANPIQDIENPIFTIISANQTTLLDNQTTICGKLTESGLIYNLDRHLPHVILKNIESVLVDSFGVAKPDWNEMFWAVHPGGPAILDKIELGLGLRAEKLRASRHVLREFGNMSSASVWFVLDEMRRRSMEELMESTGEGMKYGVLLGFGPGVTVETVVLRSAP